MFGMARCPPAKTLHPSRPESRSLPFAVYAYCKSSLLNTFHNATGRQYDIRDYRNPESVLADDRDGNEEAGEMINTTCDGALSVGMLFPC
jgi:hypothetical protein